MAWFEPMRGSMALSSRGLGRRPLTAVTRVRIPLGLYFGVRTAVSRRGFSIFETRNGTVGGSETTGYRTSTAPAADTIPEVASAHWTYSDGDRSGSTALKELSVRAAATRMEASATAERHGKQHAGCGCDIARRIDPPASSYVMESRAAMQLRAAFAITSRPAARLEAVRHLPELHSRGLDLSPCRTATATYRYTNHAGSQS